MSKRAVVLAVLDGWGIGNRDFTNPIHVAEPQNIAYLKSHFPSGALQASGISVGLPWGEEGNSEVGHLNMGAGRIVYQHYPQISLAIQDRSFFENSALKKVFAHVRKNNSAVNLVGLLGTGHVHSSLGHIATLIAFAQKEGVKKINLHLFTDGRDSAPESCLELLKKIPLDKLASLSGRFYAMDRDNHWDHTSQTYQTLIGNAPIIKPEEIESHVKKTYAQNLNDEYVQPVLIGPEPRPIQDTDGLIFFNFREDRMRQIVSAFVIPQFDKFPVKKFPALSIATMTVYDEKFDVPAAFPPVKAENPLAKILADNGKVQFRIAETQKYAHITYFFNGLREEPFPNEYRILIPSKSILKPDEKPEMMAREISNRLLEAITEGVFDFFLVNYANPDVIAHTGNFDACVEAVKIIDEEIGKLTRACLDKDYFLIITSDHGNVERLRNPSTGEPETKHDPNPVPIYFIAKEFERLKSKTEAESSEKNMLGILADVAPTILEFMGLKPHPDMTGQSLLRYLR